MSFKDIREENKGHIVASFAGGGDSTSSSYEIHRSRISIRLYSNQS